MELRHLTLIDLCHISILQKDAYEPQGAFIQYSQQEYLRCKIYNFKYNVEVVQI